jgi:HPr kinase/phosphorylase
VVEVIRPAAAILVGRCPALLCDFLEVRGLGVVNVRRLYGDEAIAPMQRLDLIVNLDAPVSGDPAQRLSGRRSTREVLGLAVPEIYLKARVGHNQRALVEAACRDHWLRLFGYCSDEDFNRRQQAAVLKDQP